MRFLAFFHLIPNRLIRDLPCAFFHAPQNREDSRSSDSESRLSRSRYSLRATQANENRQASLNGNQIDE